MSCYCAQVGELIIKPEYRKDFQRLYLSKFDEIEDEGLRSFISMYEIAEGNNFDFIEMKYWHHQDCKAEWVGKYRTCYDEKTGHFVYGVYYNSRCGGVVMYEFLDLISDMAQKEIYMDDWDEDDWYKNR